MFRFIIPFFCTVAFLLTGCQTTAPSAAPQTPIVAPVKEPSPSAKTWRESFPAGKADQSAELYAALKSAGAPLEKTAEAERLRVYDLTCLLKSNSEKYSCSYQTQPGRGKSFHVTARESTRLADLLFGLPVSQGDSGVSTRFVECVHYAPQSQSQPSCTIAIELDYVGP